MTNAVCGNTEEKVMACTEKRVFFEFIPVDEDDELLLAAPDWQRAAAEICEKYGFVALSKRVVREDTYWTDYKE